MASKQRTSFNISDGLAKRARNTVMALGGPPLFLNLTKLAEQALIGEIERLEREFNKGQPFADYSGSMKTGRPIGK